MEKVNVESAVGMVLAHDMTQVIPGKVKGPRFKKGHIVKEEDIPELLKLGKRSIYILNLSDSELHEDDAALRIASAISGNNLNRSQPEEGKSSIRASSDGLLKVNVEGLFEINMMDNIIVSTLKTNFPCKKGQVIAGTRIIPLTIRRKQIEEVEKVAHRFDPVLQIKEYARLRVGAVVTGYEIYKGLIKDEFDHYVGKKVSAYGSEVIKKIIAPDEEDAIADAILDLKETGCELILTTGGLSVDPDDITPQGVKMAGAETIVYGSPVLPGAMFLYALLDEIPILGLPACVYYHEATIFDLILPRVLAGEQIVRQDIAEMGYGGLCMNCEQCRYPICPFGK